jgi:uncharacterized Zn-binding protein involved in type VI secretion
VERKMPAIQRMSDSNSGGGSISSIPQNTFYVDSLLACVNGSIGTSHSGCPNVSIHCSGNWDSANGSSTFFIQGIAANYTGNSDTCGHTRSGGSSTFFID